MARIEKVIAAVADLLGPVELAEDHSWPGIDLAVVVRLRTESGRELIAKSHAASVNFDRELTAYRRWVPALGDRVPTLVAADEEAGVVVLTPLPGTHLEEAIASGESEEALYADAGALVRRLHDTQTPEFDEGWAEHIVARVEKWIGRAGPGVLDADDVVWVRRQVHQLLDLPPPPLVICHGDWQPRNWRVDGGVVRAFDFERTEPDWWIFDFQRMWLQQWRDKPHLSDAFFDGYGRRPTEVELRGTWAICAGRALMQIPYAIEHGDAAFADAAREVIRWMRARGIPSVRPG